MGAGRGVSTAFGALAGGPAAASEQAPGQQGQDEPPEGEQAARRASGQGTGRRVEQKGGGGADREPDPEGAAPRGLGRGLA